MVAVEGVGGVNALVDLRSDTVTRPTAAMKAAMQAAELGDDVFGDDPTVKALEAAASALVGKEAGLFVPSGTQSNLIAMLTHCGRGEEILIGEDYHVFIYEAGGASALGGAVYRPLRLLEDGAPDPAAIARKVDDSHFPISKVLSLENTHHGAVVPQDRIEACVAAARAQGLAAHLDGARLMNAAIASNRTPADLAAPFDTVSICLSKGLGAPVGSVLTGPSAFIARARRQRKMLGGGMRQAGVIAAAGLHALEHHIERLEDDHARAQRLADGLRAIDGLAIEGPATNMVFVTCEPEHDRPLGEHLAKAGVVAASGPKRRLVTHLDIDDEAVERAIESFSSYFETI